MMNKIAGLGKIVKKMIGSTDEISDEAGEVILKKLQNQGDEVVKKIEVPAYAKSMNKSPDELLAKPPLNANPSGISDNVANQIAEEIPMQAPKSNKTMRNILAGTGIAAGLGGAYMMGGDDQESQAQIPMQRPPEPNAPIAPAPVQAPVNKASVVPSAKPVIAPQAPVEEAPVASPEDDYLQQLALAQKGQNDNNMIDNMLRAGTTIGSAIAGTKADYSQIDALQKQNGIGVQNLKDKMTADMDSKKLKAAQGDLDDDTKLRDPNSDMSRTLREMLSKLGYPVNDKVSGKQLKDMGINVYNLLSQKEAREQGRLNREATMNNSNTERTKSAVDRGMQNIRNGKEYKSYNNAKDALIALDSAIASGDKVEMGKAFNNYAKFAQNDDSVVRSEDMKVLAGGTNYTNPKEYIAYLAAQASGGRFTANELKSMKKMIEIGMKLKGERVYQQFSPIGKKIENNGLNAEEHVDPAEMEEFGKYAPAGEKGASSYSPQEEAAISMVMQKNGVDKNTAINALKKAGKIK